jgi:hypothetical protein
MKVIPTWGYRAGEAEIFQLAEGESLPAGWEDSPAKVGAAKAAPDPVKPEDVTDWRAMHWKQRVKLAKELTGNSEITAPDEADKALEAHYGVHNQ